MGGLTRAQRLSKKKGISQHVASVGFLRTFGDLVVVRLLFLGEDVRSLTLVVCRWRVRFDSEDRLRACHQACAKCAFQGLCVCLRQNHHLTVKNTTAGSAKLLESKCDSKKFHTIDQAGPCSPALLGGKAQGARSKAGVRRELSRPISSSQNSASLAQSSIRSRSTIPFLASADRAAPKRLTRRPGEVKSVLLQHTFREASPKCVAL